MRKSLEYARSSQLWRLNFTSERRSDLSPWCPMEGEKQSKKLLHVIVGSPDEDNCPICKAHKAGSLDQAIDSDLGQVRVQELSLHDILQCACPLCVQTREQSLED